jgi:hypothetical protein
MLNSFDERNSPEEGESGISSDSRKTELRFIVLQSSTYSST